MKYVTFVKQHPCVQLAHLYEHLFISAATEYLYCHNQYKLLDYALHGETYEPGIIIIHGECYHTKTENFLESVVSARVNVSRENPGYISVTRATSQLYAEESQKLFVGNTDMIIRELELLDNQPWHNLDSVDTLPKAMTNDKNLADLIYETNQPANKKSTIHLQLQIDSQPTERRVLWRELARFISISIGQKICHNFGMYFNEESAKDNDTFAVSTSVFSVDPYACPKINMTEIIATTTQTLTAITTPEVLKRFSNYLTSLSFTNNPLLAPDSSRIAQEFGMIIGAAGWKKLATMENLQEVLGETRISFRYKNNTIRIE